jgi:hypothetical protein
MEEDPEEAPAEQLSADPAAPESTGNQESKEKTASPTATDS